jgi:hypothetical protein
MLNDFDIQHGTRSGVPGGVKLSFGVKIEISNMNLFAILGGSLHYFRRKMVIFFEN